MEKTSSPKNPIKLNPRQTAGLTAIKTFLKLQDQIFILTGKSYADDFFDNVRYRGR